VASQASSAFEGIKMQKIWTVEWSCQSSQKHCFACSGKWYQWNNCESDLLAENHNYNSTLSLDGMVATRQMNESDGLHDAPNDIFDDYYSNKWSENQFWM